MSDSNLDSILAAGRALGAVRTEHNGIPFAVVPACYNLCSIEQFLTVPARKRGELVFTEVESFCRYTNAHKTAGTHLFAAGTNLFAGSGSVSAVLDYHSAAGPGWREHKATLCLQATTEWTKLNSINRKALTQEQFCEFLEDNQSLIVRPTSAELLEIVSTLEGKKDVQFSQAIKLRNGQVKLGYSENIELKGAREDGSVELPAKLVAGAARYKGGEPVEIHCRLRFRIAERKLLFTILIDDLEIINEAAYLGVLKQIEEVTKIKPLI